MLTSVDINNILISVDINILYLSCYMNCLKCLRPLEESSSRYGAHNKCFIEWFQVSSTATFTNITRRDNASNENNMDIIPQNNSFFHGKFKKYSAILGEQ